MAKLLINATIFTGEAFIEGHNVLIEGGLVQDLVSHRTSIKGDVEIIDCRDSILSAGFIDLQVNGGDNILFNATPTPAAALAIAAAHRRRGTTSLLPTCITDKPETMRAAIAAVREVLQQDNGILGIHLEGPHLSTAKRGVHDATQIRALNSEDMSLYRRCSDEIILITLAPDAVAPETIHQLHLQGNLIALGHSDADAGTVRAALTAGATGFTHLFNGMGGLQARHPGMSGVALDDAASYAGLIADGYHVSAEMLRLAVRAKGADKIFLVSDAMPPAAADQPKNFELYGETISTDGRQCLTADGRLAGAALTLADCVHHAIHGVKIPPEDVLRMASTTPAEFIGMGDKLGKILPGFQAHIVALDTQFKVKRVWV